MRRRITRHPHSRRAALVLVVALALAGAACGGDDDSSSESDGATGAAAAGPAEAGDGGDDTATFCDARVGLEAQFVSEQPDVEAVTALLGDLEAAAPDDIAADAAGLAGILAGAVESGTDPSEDPAFLGYLEPIDDFALGECADEVIEVTAADYHFDGLPETVAAGTVGVTMTNGGAEPHVLLLVRVNDGDTTPMADLLALPEQEAAQHASLVAAAFAEPGGAGVTFVELDSGRYIAYCPIPMGGGEDGPPHFTQGMAAELEVM